MKAVSGWVVLGLVWPLVACSSGGGGGAPARPAGYESPWDAPDEVSPAAQNLAVARYALEAAQSCDEVTAQWREAALVSMREKLRAARQSLVEPRECPDWTTMGADAAASADSGGGWVDDEEGASEYSTTNTQEVGVDEADFLKNDGKFLYILAEGHFQTFDAWPPEEARRLSSVAIEGVPQRLFVHEDVAIVYSSLGTGYYQPPCTYGYDCEFTGDGSDLLVTVFDIADKTQPRKVRELRFEGSFLAARRIENLVYTVVYFADPPLPDLPAWPEALQEFQGQCVDQMEAVPALPVIDEAFDELLASNTRAIEELDFTAWLPAMSDTWFVDGRPQPQSNPLERCEGYFLSQSQDGASLLSLVSFDLTTLGPSAASTVVARPGAVYASQQSLYVAVRHARQDLDFWYGEVGDGADEATTIHQFVLAADAPDTAYVGSGVVKGRVLNQFSMDAYHGDLRIATTNGRVPSPNVHSTLTILRPGADGLEPIGVLDQIAPTEDIRSVRFGGDVGYVVTFKKTDPLFVIDLSDPTDPRMQGELKIPGFSTYMHFLDETHLLTIGYDADDQGSFAWFQGIQLQVLDVTDGSNPALLHKEVIGTRGSSSDAATDHLAFTFFRPRELLAIPMVVCEDSEGGGSYGTQMTFNGLMVYHVTVADGFAYRGGVSHAVATETDYDEDLPYWQRYDDACTSWWTSSSSTVKRSVFMDDYVFSIALDRILVSRLDDLDHPVADLSLLP